jgi:acyl carrier protein phosphodiesterase
VSSNLARKMKKNTLIENQLLEMIQPRIQLIENKFSNGEALSDQDVNTLLLKSAFNHINHFEMRLDELAADVAQLRLDFSELEVKFHHLESRFYVLEGKFHSLEARFETLEARFISFESRMEATIEKTMKSNIKWTLGLMTFCLTLFKIIDLVIHN